jgi:hypothetical protein
MRMTQPLPGRLIEGPKVPIQAAILHQPPSNLVIFDREEDLFWERYSLLRAFVSQEGRELRR